MSSLGGANIASLTCHVPEAGAWWASVVLASGSTAPALGPTTLVIGNDLTMAGTIVRSGLDGPSQPRAVVLGGAGWWLPLARPESWQSDAGVKLRAVLKALSKATGEPVALPADASIGLAFGWSAAAPDAPSTGAMALDALVELGAIPTWRVEPGGGTAVTPWPAIGAADARGRVGRRHLGTGARDIGLDVSAAAFLPGATIEGAAISRVIFHETAGELTAQVWDTAGGATQPQGKGRDLLELMRAIVFKVAPSLALSGLHRYVVARAAGDGRYDLEPAPKMLHGPRLRVEQWAAPGVEAGLNVGDELAIVFLDNSEKYPAIVAHVPLRRSTPSSLRIDCKGAMTLGASASKVEIGAALGGVPRYGDTVTIGSTVGVLVFTGPFVPQGPLNPAQAQVKV